MFIDLGMRVEMTDEQFVEEMAMRRHRLALGPNDHVVGCPLCMVIPANGDMSYFADAEWAQPDAATEAESSGDGQSGSGDRRDSGNRRER